MVVVRGLDVPVPGVRMFGYVVPVLGLVAPALVPDPVDGYTEPG